MNANVLYDLGESGRRRGAVLRRCGRAQEAAAEMGALAVTPAAVGSGRVVVGVYLGGLGRLGESVAIDYGRRCGAQQAGEEAI